MPAKLQYRPETSGIATGQCRGRIKIASNTALAQKKPRWIDFDAGQVLDGTSMEDAADQLMQLILDTASGKPARNELNDEREIAIWKTGVTL